jgi:hypothetical protein
VDIEEFPFFVEDPPSVPDFGDFFPLLGGEVFDPLLPMPPGVGPL